ncbi:MAG: hypothetical protein AB7G28_00755 [Pirellulales bacterium]
MKALLSICILLVANRAIFSQGVDDVRPPSKSQGILIDAPDEPANTSLPKNIWKGYYKSYLNVRFHERRANDEAWWGMVYRCVGIILSVVGFAIPVVTYQLMTNSALRKRTVGDRYQEIVGNPWVNAGTTVVGALFLIAGIILSFSSADAMSIRHAELRDEWRDLRNQFDDARTMRGKVSESELKQTYDKLVAQMEAIEKKEPPLSASDRQKLREEQYALNVALGIRLPDGKTRSQG